MTGLANDLNISEPGFVSHNGSGVFRGRTITGSGTISVSNGDGISGNPIISSSGPSTDLHTARLIVCNVTAGTGANYTTIQSAIDAAQGTGINQTIFIQPRTDGIPYTENLTLRPGINLSAFICDALTPNVTISGKLTFTEAGTVSISGIRLQSNGAEFLSVTGSASSIVNLTNCFLSTAFNPGITFSSLNVTAQINLINCSYNISAASVAFYNMSSTGAIQIQNTFGSNSGLSKTYSNNSAGTVTYYYCALNNPISSSSTGVLSLEYSTVSTSALTDNTITSLIYNGSGVSLFRYSKVLSGTASAISIGSGATLSLDECLISSSNSTAAITGAGTVNHSILRFTSTSSIINTTTQNGGCVQGIVANISGTSQNPSVGFIGESISNTATAVATTNGTAKTIASVALTPGVWDISGIAGATATGGTAIMTAMQLNISTTDNTLVGTLGIELFQIGTLVTSSNVLSGCIPQYRVKLSANTTYYLVVANFFTSTTCPTNGRISATRVG